MTQDKLNKAIYKLKNEDNDIICCGRYNNYNNQIGLSVECEDGIEQSIILDLDEFKEMVFKLLTQDELKSLLQSDDEGMEVTLIDKEKDEIYTYFACCPRKDCNNGSIVINSNYCQKCGQKLTWPDSKNKSEGK